MAVVPWCVNFDPVTWSVEASVSSHKIAYICHLRSQYWESGSRKRTKHREWLEAFRSAEAALQARMEWPLSPSKKKRKEKWKWKKDVMRSHDLDRADLIIASRSSRALSHSDVLRLSSACAPSFAGCLGLKLLFFSGASWHNIKQTQTLCTQGTWNTSSLSLYRTYRYLLTYPRRFLFPTSVSSLTPARADRQPPLLPSSASELPVNRPIRLFFSSGLV